MVKIGLTNEAGNKEQQDLATYYDMVKRIVNKINSKGLEATAEEGGTRLYYVIRGSTQDFAEVYPLIFGEKNTIREVMIDVYDETSLDCIKKIVDEFREKYQHLEEITLSTHFKDDVSLAFMKKPVWRQ